MAPRKRNAAPSPSPSGGAPGRQANGDRRPQRAGFSGAQLVALFVLLLGANYVGISWLREWWGKDGDPLAHSPTMYTVSGGVETRRLSSPEVKFAEECRASGQPVVLRNSVVEKWRARRLWSPKYLQSRIPRIDGVYRNDNRWFGPYYDSSKPLTHLSTRTNNYATGITMKSKKFFKKLAQPSEGEFLYFTGDIDQLGEWAVEEVEPLSELLVLNPQRSSVNVWIGQPHVIAHCHYDGYHNFYAQLYGTKKFTLFSPDEWPGLYPYPFLHPSHAQSQVNLSDITENTKFPLAERVRGLEVVLKPGDLLYIPPLWFHLVESLETSISVNVWTDSTQTLVVEGFFSVPLPTDAVQWNTGQERAVATSLLIHTLLSEVCRRRFCRRVENDRFIDNQGLRPLEGELYFMYQLWTTRYRTLMEGGTLPDGVHDDTAESEAILCERMSREESKSLSENVNASLAEADLQEYVDLVAGGVQQLPDDTWELWVGNYVEYLAATAVEVELVGAFLRHYGSCIVQ